MSAACCLAFRERGQPPALPVVKQVQEADRPARVAARALRVRRCVDLHHARGVGAGQHSAVGRANRAIEKRRGATVVLQPAPPVAREADVDRLIARDAAAGGSDGVRSLLPLLGHTSFRWRLPSARRQPSSSSSSLKSPL